MCFILHCASTLAQPQTYHHASLEEQVMDGLRDISSMHQIVVGVLVFAVAHLQRIQKW